jgi:hypothetical protein
MRDRPWLIAEIAIAALLLAVSLVGILAAVLFDEFAFFFSFQGGIQAYAIFPGLVLSLVVNVLIQRAHRAAGLSRAEKILLSSL